MSETLTALALSECGNAAPQQAVSHNALEGMLVNSFPVYWLGGSFHRLTISEAFHDTSGAYSIQYGGCRRFHLGRIDARLKEVASANTNPPWVIACPLSMSSVTHIATVADPGAACRSRMPRRCDAGSASSILRAKSTPSLLTSRCAPPRKPNAPTEHR